MPPHHEQIRVYHADTDAGGVVYHATYLAYAERGRVEALRAAGAPVAELDAEHALHFLVREARIEYLRPLRLDDLFTLVTGTAILGGASASVRHDVMLNDTLTTRVTVKLACVGRQNGKPARIPRRWHAALAELRFPTVEKD